MQCINNVVGSCAESQARFLKLLPAVVNHGRFKFRCLPRVEREEAIAESVAAALLSYDQLDRRGLVHVAHPSTLAHFAVLRVRNGRHVGGRQRSADVLSPLAQRKHRFEVGPIDENLEEAGWRSATAPSRRTSIPDAAAFNIDYPRWLATHTPRHRKIIAALARGEQAMTVAERFGLSRGRISQLRGAWRRSWRQFHGEAADPQVTRAC